MAEGEIRDITVRLKVDTKQIDLKEGKTKRLFDKTNNAIKKQSNLTEDQGKKLERLLRLQQKLIKAGINPKRAAQLNKEIKALQKAGVATKKLTNETKKLKKQTGGLEKTLENLGRGLLVAFSVSALIAFGKQLNQTAIEMEAFERRASVVFGEAISLVEDFADQNAISLGLTRSEFLGAAAAIGDMVVPLGLSRQKAAEMSVGLLKTGIALKEFTVDSRSASEISDILARALTGEVESLKPLGVSIDQTSKEFKDLIETKIEDEGVTRLQAKSLAIYDLTLQRSTDAITSFETNTESLTRSQAILGANVRSLNEELAILLLPTFKEVTTAILENVESINEAETRWGKFGKVLLRTIGPQAAFVIITDALNRSTEEEIVNFTKLGGVLEDVLSVTEALKRARGELTDAFGGELAQIFSVTDALKQEVRNVFFLEAALSKLKKEQKDQTTSVKRVKEITQELIPLQKELNDLTGKQKEAVEKLTKANNDLSRANKAFRDQVFKDIEAAAKRIEDLQIDNIESEFVRDLRRIEKNRERELAAAADTLATEEQKRIELEEINEKFDQKVIDRNQRNADKLKEIREEDTQDAIDNARQRQEVINGFLQQGFDIFKQLQQSQTAIRLEQLERQGLSDQEFETKRRQILRESAEQQKNLALFEIAVATAKAVTQALAVPPSPNIPLAVLAGTLGAAQLAVVATTPIPQFAEGTLDAPGGLSMVGERGRELTVLPSGTKVLPNDKTEKYAGVIDSMFRNKFDQYIMERYVPDMLMTDTDGEVYNDHSLKGVVRNSGFNREHARWIGKEVGKNINKQSHLRNYYA